jgi:hypothetical protein
MTAQLLGRHSVDRRGDLLLQLLEITIHEGYLAFLLLSVRMLRDN